MTILDIIILGVVLSFTLISAMWGLVRQIIALFGLIIGLFIAGNYSMQVAPALGFTGNPLVSRGLAFILIVILVSLAASILASFLYFGVGLLFLGWLDALLGAGLGFVQGWLAAGVTLVGVGLLFPVWASDQLNKSLFAGKVLNALSGPVLIFAPPEIKNNLLLMSGVVKF